MKEQLLTWTLEGKRSVDGGLRVVESLVSGRENRFGTRPGWSGVLEVCAVWDIQALWMIMPGVGAGLSAA